MYLPLKVKSPFITTYPLLPSSTSPHCPFPLLITILFSVSMRFSVPFIFELFTYLSIDDLFLFLFMYLFLSSTEDNFYCFLFIFKFYCIFLHYHLTPLHSPLLHCSHHIVVCVHESFFFFAAPLHPLTSCHSCQSALCL